MIAAASSFAKPATDARHSTSHALPSTLSRPEENLAVTPVILADDPQVTGKGQKLGRSLCDGVDTLALGHYMSENGDYSYTAADLLRPFDSFFTTEYKTQATDHPSFKYASQALMLLDYSNTVKSPEVKTLAIAQYGKS